MQNQRMLIGSKKVKQKDFKAIMTVGYSIQRIPPQNTQFSIQYCGFTTKSKYFSWNMGALSPCTLDNGKVISHAFMGYRDIPESFAQEAITSDGTEVTFTIDGIENTPKTMFQYLFANQGKQVPITFHFD